MATSAGVMPLATDIIGSSICKRRFDDRSQFEHHQRIHADFRKRTVPVDLLERADAARGDLFHDDVEKDVGCFVRSHRPEPVTDRRAVDG